MKTDKDCLQKLFDEIPAEERAATRLSFEVSNKIYDLMIEKGLSKKQFAIALGRRPSEVSKWLSGEHNFTIATLAMLSTFFGKPIVVV